MSTKLLENVGEGTELGRRTYIEGVVVEPSCKCGATMKCDLSSNYLEYPVVGRWQNLFFYCGECDTEYEETFKVRILINLEIKEE